MIGILGGLYQFSMMAHCRQCIPCIYRICCARVGKCNPSSSRRHATETCLRFWSCQPTLQSFKALKCMEFPMTMTVLDEYAVDESPSRSYQDQGGIIILRIA